MNTDLLMLALIVGGFNWAFRYLPTRLDISAHGETGPLARFLAATGPAAIATLFVASALPALTDETTRILPLGAGTASVLAVYGWRRSVVAATLCGSVGYGLAFWITA